MSATGRSGACRLQQGRTPDACQYIRHRHQGSPHFFRDNRLFEKRGAKPTPIVWHADPQPTLLANLAPQIDGAFTTRFQCPLALRPIQDISTEEPSQTFAQEGLLIRLAQIHDQARPSVCEMIVFCTSLLPA
jgi:hypothetical protein